MSARATEDRCTYHAKYADPRLFARGALSTGWKLPEKKVVGTFGLRGLARSEFSGRRTRPGASTAGVWKVMLGDECGLEGRGKGNEVILR